MTPFERIHTLVISEHPACKAACQLIGENQLAILLAKTAIEGTTAKLSPTVGAKVFNTDRRTLQRFESTPAHTSPPRKLGGYVWQAKFLLSASIILCEGEVCPS
jgi:hypothetical protein